MIVKLFGLVDLVLIISIVLVYLEMSKIFALVMILFFLFKTLFFISDFASYFDLACAVIFGLTLVGFFNIVTWIALVWIGQKALFSLLA